MAQKYDFFTKKTMANRIAECSRPAKYVTLNDLLLNEFEISGT